ncbi:MAG: AraC family transcriptional regulator [Planctomycetaceae bacterium]|nr:AraC family transcriptional regulator [Planctomycetaceae bacterium]
MKPSFEKLAPDQGQSFRCLDRSTLETPVKWHRHPEIELTYVEHGSGARLVGDHIGAYTNHDLVLLGSNLPHTWNSDEYRGQKYDLHAATVIQFHPDFLGARFFETAELNRIRELLTLADRGLWYPPDSAAEIGRQMTRLLTRKGASRLILLLQILEQLTLCQPAPLASAGYTGPVSKTAETRIQLVCDHIQQHFTEPELSVADLADLLYMNPSAFSRFFKLSTSRTPTRYINELRIGYACRQLIETDRAILDICHRCGFESPSFFNRTFRRLRNCTPREFRSQHGDAATEAANAG